MERFESRVRAIGTLKFMQVKAQPEESTKDGFNAGEKVKVKDFGAYSYEETYSSTGALVGKKVKVNPYIETEDGCKLYLNQEYSRKLTSKQEFMHISSTDGKKTRTYHALEKAQDAELIATTWDIMLKANVNVAGNKVKSLIKDDLINFFIQNITKVEGQKVAMYANETYRANKDGSKVYKSIEITELRDKRDYEQDGIFYSTEVLLRHGSIMNDENYDGEKVQRFIPLNIGLQTQQKIGDNYENVIINSKDLFYLDTTMTEEDTVQTRMEKMMMMGLIYEIDGIDFDTDKVYKVKLEGQMFSEGDDKKLTMDDLNPMEAKMVEMGMMTLEKISQRRLGHSKKQSYVAFQPYFIKKEIEDVKMWSSDVQVTKEKVFSPPMGGIPTFSR